MSFDAYYMRKVLFFAKISHTNRVSIAFSPVTYYIKPYRILCYTCENIQHFLCLVSFSIPTYYCEALRLNNNIALHVSCIVSSKCIFTFGFCEKYIARHRGPTKLRHFRIFRVSSINQTVRNAARGCSSGELCTKPCRTVFIR